MTQAHYTFRVSLANKRTVQIKEYDADDNDRGQPEGSFGYKNKARDRILKLHQAAQNGKVTEAEIQELGEKLFEVLLNPVLQDRFFVFYHEAQQRGVTLRFELDINEREFPEIAALPWEFMRVKSTMGYGTLWIATSPSLVFSRHRPPSIPPSPIQLGPGERLRIALAVADPDELRKVKYKLIWKELQKWARAQRNRIELLGLVNPASRTAIDEILEQRPHILHFIGHGRVRDESERDVRQIALVDASYGTTKYKIAEWLDADRFVDLFNRHQPGVVVLQTCEGAMSSSTDAFVGVASYVVQQRIPVVVAMQYEISNATAQTFALEFYKRLAMNVPVDRAAQEGRYRIALGPTSYTSRDFATPVLFMRVKDGQLFLSSSAPPGKTSTKEKENEANDSSDSTLKSIQETLEEISKRFDAGGVIYREECIVFDSILDELGNSLDEVRQKIDPYNYEIIIPFNKVMSQRKDLQRAVHAFQDSCPPTTRRVSQSQYDAERDLISGQLTSFMTNLSELLKRLERHNMLQ